jgi:NDP-sugar pyrophosphorylase family protein
LLQCVILAGGLGTRMRPQTETVPKVLLPVAGEAFAGWQLSWLASQGVRRVLLSTGHLAHLVEDYVGDGSRWGLEIQCVREGDRLLGTAGAIRLAIDARLVDEEFCVLYGDSYLQLNVGEVVQAYVQAARPALMTVIRNQGWGTSNAVFANGTVTTYNKSSPDPARMAYIDYGLSVIRRAVIEEATSAGKPADLSDIFARLSASGQLAGYEVRDRFFEIGSPQGLLDLEQFLNARRHRRSGSMADRAFDGH